MNPFESCKTESDVMKLVFELSKSKDYSKQEIISMADERRKVLKGNGISELKPVVVKFDNNPKQLEFDISKGNHILDKDAVKGNVVMCINNGIMAITKI